MNHKFITGLLFSNLFISIEHFFGKRLAIAVLKLVGNQPENIEVLLIWVIVGRMSSRHSRRRDIGMGSKAQEVGLELFIIVCNCAIVTG